MPGAIEQQAEAAGAVARVVFMAKASEWQALGWSPSCMQSSICGRVELSTMMHQCPWDSSEWQLLAPGWG